MVVSMNRSHSVSRACLVFLVACAIACFGLLAAFAPNQAHAVTNKSTITVAIDAGHQGKANLGKEKIGPGASTSKYKVAGGATGVASKCPESKLNLAVAKRVKTELEKRGYKVYMTRTSQDVNISNKTRATRCNEKADIVIHIHADSADASGVKGASTLYPASSNKYVSSSVKTKSKKLAKAVQKAYCKATKFKNRGLSARNDLTGLNWSKIPAIYLELGFMSNKSEDKKMQKASYQKKMAKGIANGIDAYFA